MALSHKTDPVPEINFLPNELQFLKAAEKAWKTIKSDQTWEAWWKIGQALVIVRSGIMRQLRLNEAKGGAYNIAFSRYLNQYFPGLAVTKQASYILWLRDSPEHEDVCLMLRKAMTPQQRSRITDPNSMAKRVRAYLNEGEGKTRKPKPATERIRELEAENAALQEQLDTRDFDATPVIGGWFEATNIHSIARFLFAVDRAKAVELGNELLRREGDD